MIRMITGTVEYVDDGGVVLVVGGIGYLVFVPARLLDQVQIGSQMRLYTYQHVREDQLALYGFESRSDLAFFKQLIQVSGIGPKMGLQVLSRFSADEVKRAIVNGDMAVLTSISGIGRKTAERMIVDLKEAVDFIADSSSQSGTGGSHGVHVVEALLALGYSQDEAVGLSRQIDQTVTLEEQVRAALRLMSK